MSSSAALLSVRSLSVRYTRRHGPPFDALREVSFDLVRGEFLALVGASGSGKSSLARAVAGLTPYSGTVRLSEGGGARAIQLVFQDAGASLNPRRRIGAVLDEVLALRQRPRPSALELLECVGLGREHLSAAPHELSGGQRQRAAIARALAAQPSVLVCDEILSALDPSVQAQILALLGELRRGRGLGVLFVTHDLAVARRCADRVGVLHAGALVELGAPAQVFDAPTSAATRELWGARLRWPAPQTRP